ncbi:MAG: hypothetical protein KME49_18665 [Brasilonema octagenarum HA4186-MV1]|jgi:hypothetical protein|nr:hypothetical protein [Brasilonema octagenarum HA4186-MV1]
MRIFPLSISLRQSSLCSLRLPTGSPVACGGKPSRSAGSLRFFILFEHNLVLKNRKERKGRKGRKKKIGNFLAVRDMLSYLT